MKVALCLSGHMRKWEATFPYLDNYILQKYTPDVFIHTWNNRGVYKPKDGVVTNAGEVGTLEENDENINPIEIIKLFSPKDLISEAYSEWKPKFVEQTNPYYEWRDTMPEWKYTRPHDFVSFSYKIWACNDLKSKYEKNQNIIYDVVIRARTDLQWLGDLQSEIFENTNIVYTMSGHPADLAKEPNPKSIRQEVVITNSKNMDIYADLYLHMDALFNEAKEKNMPELILNQHTATWYWLDRYKLSHKHLPFNCVIYR